MIMKATPAKMDGPKVTQSKYILRDICKGPDHIMLMYVIMSFSLCASTDIKLTISPTVEFFLAAFDSLNIFKK